MSAFNLDNYLTQGETVILSGTLSWLLGNGYNLSKFKLTNKKILLCANNRISVYSTKYIVDFEAYYSDYDKSYILNIQYNGTGIRLAFGNNKSWFDEVTLAVGKLIG